MKLGVDFYDTITAYPVALRRLAECVIEGKGEVHIVSAIKRVNEERTRRHLKDARIPFTTVNLVFYEKYEDIPNLKTEVYRNLGCDLVIDDMPMVVLACRTKGLCALEIGGISNSPLVVNGR